jgi:chromosome segregation ATPase
MSEKEKLQAAAASGDVETVARVALDSAEVANRSAQTAAQTAARIAEASTRFERALAGHRKQLMLVGGISAGVALLALIIFLVAAIQLRGRVVQINSVLTVMSKRVVDLGVGLDQLASASERLDQMAAQIESVVKEQNKMVAAVASSTQALQAATKSLQTMSPPPPAPAPAPAATTASASQETPQQRAQREAQSKAAAEAAQALVAQAKALDVAIKGQAKTLSSINERVQAIESKLVSTVPAVQRDLQSLLKLESERSRSVNQAASDRQREEQLRQERERFIQFRRGGDAPAQAAPAAGAAAAAVPSLPASPRQ